MTTATITRVKNGSIALPRGIRESWMEGEIFVVSDEDTLVIKRIREQFGKLSSVAGKASSRRLSRREIADEIQAFRKRR